MRSRRSQLTLLAMIVVALGMPGVSYASASGQTGRHGFPTNTAANTCRDGGCHDSGAFAANTVSISLGGPTSLVHNTTSTNFSISGAGGTRRGFNLAIYRGAVKQTATFSSLSTGVKVLSNELTHSGGAQNIGSWTYRWAAPSTLGTYRIYACLNPVNNDGDRTSDGAAECTTRDFTVINNAPNAVNDTNAITVNEGSGLSAQFNPLSNDLTTDGDAFSWFSTTGGGSVTGTLTDNSNGTYRYNPDGLFNSLRQGQIATTNFTYTIEENSYAGSRDSAVATIRISGVNDRPVAVNDGSAISPFVTVQEGMAIDNGTDGDGGNNDIASNDTDVDTNDNQDATRTACPAGVTDPLNGTITNFGADGTFTYSHDGSNTTADSFTYCTIDDSGAGTNKSSNSATVYIQITPVNDKPTITTSAGNTAFTEQTAVVVDSNLTLVDGDSTELGGATAQITGNPQPGDQLACGALPAGISCSAPGTTVTLSSATTNPIADYDTALEAVTFTSSSDNPDLGARTVTFIVEDDLSAFSDAVASARKTISPINRTNDSPALAAVIPPVLDVDSNNAYENTAGDPYTFTYTAVASDVDVNDDINDGSFATGGSGSLTYSLMNFPTGMTISNDNANPGLITWDPPITGTFGQVYGPITVRVVDGGENGSVAATRAFSVTVSPPDGDGDGFANYNDFCPTTNSATNLDFDGDGTAGSDGGPPDNLTDFTGGDDCDADDDNDGMPDSFEVANSFDPLNAADAGEDADGDGISNLQEFLDDTSPTQANVVIDATGYLTSYDLNLVPPEPTSIHSDATEVTPIFEKRPTDLSSTTGPYRPGDNTITWRLSNSTESDLVTNVPGNLVSEPPEQPFFIRPLVSFGVDQQVEENTAEAVTVTVRLNGDSPAWTATPIADATVNYSVSGTAANPDDHNAIAGVLNFGVGDYEEDITFNVLTDGIADPNETIVFTLTGANNAAIGSNNTHTVTILEDNIAPRARIQFRQGGFSLGSTFEGSAITIDAMPSDANDAQLLSCNWSGTDNALLPPGIVADCVTTPDWQVLVPVAGNYLVDVVVTDNGSPARSTRVSRILHVAAGTVVALGTGNSDGEGDNDATEGYADSDGDGIPDYLDDARVVGGNLIPDQTADPAASLLLETEPGLTLRRGSTTQAANIFGALVTDSAIAQFGSVRGDAPLNGGDAFEHVGGVYDFEIDGLLPGSSARIVIPLQSAIPRDARYRKFNPATGWSDFVVDANNQIASASGELGACPEPGSSAYVSGLNYLDNCIQLTIQDGGPNDTDNQVNGVINDPATVGVTITEPEGFEEVEEGSGGRVSPLLLAVMLLLGGLAFWRRQRGVRIDK